MKQILYLMGRFDTKRLVSSTYTKIKNTTATVFKPAKYKVKKRHTSYG